MSEKKEEECPSEEPSSQTESFDTAKSGTSETYDMKDFCPGIRIEAKDFDGKWYPAKVSDVDWTENEILVHFENWNTKFDEWIPMDSSRLRPIQKPTPQQKDAVKFTKGEEVMAVWSANQKYPGVIQAVLANDRYDVLFCDGFLKRLKGHKISKFQGSTVKTDVKRFPDIGTKEERRERKRKINVAELFHINKRSKKKGLVHSKPQDIKTYPVTKPKSKSSVLKKPTLEENKRETENSESTELNQTVDKPIVSTPLQANKSLVENIPAAFEVKYLNGQTEMWSKKLYQRSEGRTAGKLDIVILNPQGRKFRSRNEIMKYCEENGIVYSHEAFDFSAKGRPKSKSIVQTPSPKLESVEDKDKLSLKKGGRKPQSDTLVSSQNLGGISQPLEVFPQENVPNKVFIGDYEVVIENGKFICPVKICAKHFRRENLLHMHMKHYHPEFSKYLDYTPSVTDLAYARTVGNLDAVEVPSPTPRKLTGSTEKVDKSALKVENVRKASEISPDSAKEAKKMKIESKVEGRSYPVKPSPDTPTPLVISEQPIEQRSKFNAGGLQLPRSNLNPNEVETPVVENTGNSVDTTSREPVLEGESLISAPTVVKSVRHKRLHPRKKAGRFQGSFADHIRKKRFISQERSRSHNRIGRQQQSQQLRQQLQPAQPSQTTISPHPCVEDTNSNVLSQGHTMARHPKPHLNLSNEISGKNNLVTNCKAVSPASEKNEINEHSSESTEKSSERRGVESINDLEESVKIKFSEKERQRESDRKNQSVYSRRSYLTGLLNARKRKGIALSKRSRKKKRERLRKAVESSGAGLMSNKSQSGHGENIEKPDKSEKGNNVQGGSLTSAENSTKGEGESSVRCSLNSPGLGSKEDVESLRTVTKDPFNPRKCLKLRIKRLSLANIEAYMSCTGESSRAERSGATEPVPKSSQEGRENGINDINKADDETIVSGSERKIKRESVKYSPPGVGFEGKFKCEINPKDLPKSGVLLENVCRKESLSKCAGLPLKGNDENVASSSYGESKSRQRRGQKKRKKSKKPNRGSRRERRRAPGKRVRFENTVLEKWIGIDEEETFHVANPKEGIRREEKKRKQRKFQLEYQNENEMSQLIQSDDSSREEKSYLNNKTSRLDQAEGTEDSKSPIGLENDKVEKLRRNEIINCLCGITEEDGLMIQCDLCLCWQHGHCAGILRELDVPDKYTCAICKNPYRGRSSMRYLHDQEWLKEGTLPSLSFRSKREDLIDQRRAILKRSHDLSGSITLLAQVIHSLRIKVNIAEKKDHPKLWLWAKKWTEKKPNRLKESETKERNEEQNIDSSIEVKTEGVTQDEKQLPKAPEPEAPIDSAECRLNLLDHLIHYQTLIDARLSCIESLVAELESMQDDAVNDETPDCYPRTKATVQMILRDLNTMKKIATI